MTYVNKGSVTAIGVIFSVLTVLLLGIRSSRFVSHRIELDDILIILAAPLTIAAGIGMIVGAQLDIIAGHSTIPVITPFEYERLGKFQYAFWICHVLAIGLIKLSILFLFRRIFRGRAFRSPFDYANWTLIAGVALWTVVFLFFSIFACGIRPYLSWSSMDQLRGDCVDTFAMQTGSAVFSWVMDLAILIEPLFMIGSLNMKRQRKIQASLIFLFSIFAVVAGLLRMIVWIQIQMQGTSNPTVKVLGDTYLTTDITGAVSVILFWTYVEIGVGFVVACVPPCAALLDKFAHSSMSRIRSLSSVKFLLSRSNNSKAAAWESSQRSKEPKSSLKSHKTSAPQSEDDIELVANGEAY